MGKQISKRFRYEGVTIFSATHTLSCGRHVTFLCSSSSFQGSFSDVIARTFALEARLYDKRQRPFSKNEIEIGGSHRYTAGQSSLLQCYAVSKKSFFMDCLTLNMKTPPSFRNAGHCILYKA